ncbi:MAG: heavy metal-binding domain-containing protein [Metamycoplasmataceae bacterium]
MILTTTDIIPGKQYEIIGLVFGNRTISIFNKTQMEKAIKKLEEQATELKADAVIGIRPYTANATGSTCIIGTAVKFI